MEYQLRDYQKIQLDFLKSHLPISNVCGIQSGTGSGKSIVMLTFIKEWLKDPKNQLSNVIVSTGFNNLVFDLEKRAEEMGLNPIVLIGVKAINCPLKMEDDYKIFTQEDFTCGNEHKHLDTSTDIWEEKRCPYCNKEYQKLKNTIENAHGRLIITNHSSLLAYQNMLDNIGVIMVDEAHTFGNFYDSYLELRLDKKEVQEMDKAITSLKEPMSSIIRLNIKNNVQLPRIQIEKLCDNIKHKKCKSDVYNFFTVERNFNNFVEVVDGEYVLSRFYKYFELPFVQSKIILFSATLDKYTLSMFRARESHIYIEHKMFCDYSNSEFVAIPNDDFKTSLTTFLNYVNSKGLEKGLILSTTISDMKIALTMNGYLGYKMFTDRNEFLNFQEKGCKKILVGSRGLFQGIDIPELQFVCLNKIPFPNWNDKTKALQNFLTNFGTNSFDPWNEFTIPKCENDISQSFGRLWRKPDSKGVVSIFDSRIEKFKYIFKHTIYYQRHGIKSLIIKNDGNPDCIDTSPFDYD